MKAIVIYESMFGNTRQIAEAIARGLADGDDEVRLVDVNSVMPGDVADADVMVVGGPTHVHGMSRASTRAEAAKWALDARRGVTLEAGAPGRGIRDWLDDPATVVAPLFAAFATRSDLPIVLSGNAAAQIDHALQHRNTHRVARPQNFIVTKESRLRDDDLVLAHAWGALVARKAAEPRKAGDARKAAEPRNADEHGAAAHSLAATPDAHLL